MLAWSNEIVYTYDVVWEHSPIAWASRWDLYLYMGDDQVHWFSILNSLVIVLLLSGIVAMIMVRTLRRDLAEYNSVEEKEELLEESGWKLVHADVLRPPPLAAWLATTIGTGMQVLCMSFISIACAMLGFLSPANRGSMLTVSLLLFALMGVAAGYCAALAYKAFKGAQWKSLTLLTAFLFPGIVLGVMFVLNFFIWGQHSSGAVPFGTMFAVLCIWRRTPRRRLLRPRRPPRPRPRPDPARRPHAQVPHLLPSRLGGRLARLPRHAQGPARQDQHGPARHPLPGLVPPPPLHDAHRRHPAVWRRLHRALLHHVLCLAAALLLCVWLPRSGSLAHSTTTAAP